MKGQRQRLIADWLREGRVGSQEELVARLALTGIVATQATVSRDLEELGAIKRRGDGGYALENAVAPMQADAKLDRLLAEHVTVIMPAGSLIVLRTPPGSASLVASTIDVAALPEIVGTIAGDDTIFLALADGIMPGAFAVILNGRRRRG